MSDHRVREAEAHQGVAGLRARQMGGQERRGGPPAALAFYGLVEQVLGSAALKGFTASIGKEISRSLFGTTRRR